jgi:hypothetical protein
VIVGIPARLSFAGCFFQAEYREILDEWESRGALHFESAAYEPRPPAVGPTYEFASLPAGSRLTSS